MRNLWPLILSLAACLPLACSSAFDFAVGPNGDATLFSDFPAGDARRDGLRGLLTTKIDTPVRPESPFKVDVTDSTQFRSRRLFRNLVILTDLSAERWGARTIQRLLGEEQSAQLASRSAAYRFLSDVWADGQTVLLVHARDGAALADLLAEHGATILDQFDDRIIGGLTKTLFETYGEQELLSRGIGRRHGYQLRIPEDFFVEEQPENRYVRIKKAMPNGAMLYLSIYYQDQIADTLSGGFCVALRDTLAAVYSGGDRVELSRTTQRPTTFAGREAIEIYGLYQNLSPPMGGPFKLFGFHDGGRLYVIDLSVFNPPGNKLPQLRILEAVARTFTPVTPG